MLVDPIAAVDGKRVGLITNHTGLTSDGRTTIDALHKHERMTLARLFGPEHGLRGELDQVAFDGAFAGGMAHGCQGGLQLGRAHPGVAAGQQLEQLPLAGNGVAGRVAGQRLRP